VDRNGNTGPAQTPENREKNPSFNNRSRSLCLKISLSLHPQLDYSRSSLEMHEGKNLPGFNFSGH
jgi:hypothetical protein